MKRFILPLFAAFMAVSAHAQKHDMNYYIEKAPFEFGEVQLPSIPERDFNLTDFGAVGDGVTLNTEAFKTAINAISEAGGGRLIVPKGVWLTGPIEIKSKLDFHVEEGAIVQFTPDLSQYPIRENSPGKFDVTPPIYGTKLTDVAFTGKGIFDGAGEAWRPVKKFKLKKEDWEALVASGGVLSDDGKVWWPTAAAKEGEKLSKVIAKKKDATAEDYLPLRDYLRPKMFTLSKVDRLLIDGPTFRNSPKFVVNPQQVTNFVLRNATVYNPKWAQNGDAVDISASKNVIIYNVKVNAGDDGICMKSSGKSKDGKPLLENIIIAECTVNDAHGGFVIGSNTDGGMSNIYVANCLFDGSDVGIRVKSNSGRGGDVNNIYIENIKMDKIKEAAVSFDTFYSDAPVGSTKESKAAQHTGDKIPFFHHFYINNVDCASAKTAFFFRGLPEQPIQDMFFSNMTIQSKEGVVGENAERITLESVTVNGSTSLAVDEALKDAIIVK